MKSSKENLQLQEQLFKLVQEAAESETGSIEDIKHLINQHQLDMDYPYIDQTGKKTTLLAECFYWNEFNEQLFKYLVNQGADTKKADQPIEYLCSYLQAIEPNNVLDLPLIEKLSTSLPSIATSYGDLKQSISKFNAEQKDQIITAFVQGQCQALIYKHTITTLDLLAVSKISDTKDIQKVILDFAKPNLAGWDKEVYGKLITNLTPAVCAALTNNLELLNILISDAKTNELETICDIAQMHNNPEMLEIAKENLLLSQVSELFAEVPVEGDIAAPIIGELDEEDVA